MTYNVEVLHKHAGEAHIPDDLHNLALLALVLASYYLH
jgi:hypothetical protein